MRLIDKLLRRNTSPGRLAGFALSNFIGLLIVAGAVMFYSDARRLWDDEDSFVRTDYLVFNKKVSGVAGLGGDTSTRFSAGEVADLREQPWVRRVAPFSVCDFRVYASVDQGGRGLETALFFEAIPDSFVDVRSADWQWHEGDAEIPIVIPRDYLALYNFGFAGSAGMPQMSEQLLSGIPLSLYMRSEDGTQSMKAEGRIVGFSNRLNTVLVPESFMEYANSRLGSGRKSPDPSRLIVDVSSPGDVAIADYVGAHGWEIAGDKSGSSAAYLLKVAMGIVMAVGALITLLSFFILMLSISLLMEKNRETIHRLLMLGTPLGRVSAPYIGMIAVGCAAAWILAMGALFLLRRMYMSALEGLGVEGEGFLWAFIAGTALTIVVFILNVLAVRRKTKSAWGLRISRD